MNPAIALLLHLRDWERPQRPFNNLIVLIALRDAATSGLRAGQLSRLLGKPSTTDAAVYLLNLEKSGLVLRHHVPERRSTCYWTLTPLGRDHVAKLLTVPDFAVTD
jgi:DNA-binding HxlR family transcriptional regulator